MGRLLDEDDVYALFAPFNCLKGRDKMILNAEQARERARENTPAAKLVRRIMQDILAQSDKGKFHLVYWPEGENNYTIRHAADALRRLGYVVAYGDRDEGISLWVDWEK
jgi:hypothetical protein